MIAIELWPRELNTLLQNVQLASILLRPEINRIAAIGTRMFVPKK